MASAATKTIRLHSPAKINLFLQVTGKRPDNYHELITLMCPISLYDDISLSFGTGPIVVKCSDPKVPEDETNLAHRAAVLFLNTVNKSTGIRISIDKHIPVAAGLGGGSSNAAAVLLGVNRFFGVPLAQDRLMELGASIGADVPFFIFNRPAIATGIGEKLESYHLLRPFRILLIYPGYGVSTAEIFKNLNLRLTNCEKNLRNLFFNNGLFDACHHLCNDLEPVTASRYPDINSARSSLLNHGAVGALMSGSGPTVFGLYSDSMKAQAACRVIQKEHPAWRLFLADLVL